MGELHLVGFAEIGGYLRDVRHSLQVDARVAAQALRIRPNYLEALEAGRLQDLPGLTYARGYVSSYADYLQVDREKILAAFDEAINFRPSKPYLPEPTKQGVRPGIGLLIVTVLLLLGMMVAWQTVVAPSASQLLDVAPETASLRVAQPAKIGPRPQPLPTARQCLVLMPVQPEMPFCHWQPLPKWLGMTPRMLYSSELVFPSYLILTADER
jgi:cytoskeletal protein RodZ